VYDLPAPAKDPVVITAQMKTPKNARTKKMTEQSSDIGTGVVFITVGLLLKVPSATLDSQISPKLEHHEALPNWGLTAHVVALAGLFSASTSNSRTPTRGT
jgi:hypothetical protein